MSHPTKKNQDILPALCIEKRYKYFKDVVCNNQEFIEATHMTAYLDALSWLRKIFVKIDAVDPNVALDASGSRSVIKVVAKKTHFFNENL